LAAATTVSHARPESAADSSTLPPEHPTCFSIAAVRDPAPKCTSALPLLSVSSACRYCGSPCPPLLLLARWDELVRRLLRCWCRTPPPRYSRPLVATYPASSPCHRHRRWPRSPLPLRPSPSPLRVRPCRPGACVHPSSW